MLIAATASDRLCHHHNSFSFDQKLLKLAAKVDRDQISDKFENWPDWMQFLNKKFYIKIL